MSIFWAQNILVLLAKKSYKVENAFTPVLKDGSYEVVMRFLPSHPDEISPFVENRNHMFQLKNGTWFDSCDKKKRVQSGPSVSVR